MSLSSFSAFALTRAEMKEINGGWKCESQAINYGSGPVTDWAGNCYDIYSCRRSFLGIGFGKSTVKWVPIEGCHMETK